MISSTAKMKAFLSMLIAPMLSFYAPVSALIAPLLWLVLMDIITGMYVARIVKKETLTSRGFFRKLPQLGFFFLALTASLHADPFFTEFGVDKTQAAKLVMSFYALYELFSILENLGASGLPIAKQLTNLLQAKLPADLKQELTPEKKEEIKKEEV